MGMCVIKGPRVSSRTAKRDEPEDGELSPRSTTSTTSSNTRGYGSASSQELDVVEESDHFSYPDGALWQRTIPKGRRCKPLSFSGMILYDENGKQVELTFEPEEAEDADDEYFSPQPGKLAEREEEFRSPRAVE